MNDFLGRNGWKNIYGFKLLDYGCFVKCDGGVDVWDNCMKFFEVLIVVK